LSTASTQQRLMTLLFVLSSVFFALRRFWWRHVSWVPVVPVSLGWYHTHSHLKHLSRCTKLSYSESSLFDELINIVKMLIVNCKLHVSIFFFFVLRYDRFFFIFIYTLYTVNRPAIFVHTGCFKKVAL